MRIIVLLISVALIVFLFYTYINKSITPIPSNLNVAEDINISPDDTIFDAVNYAQEAKDETEIQNCLLLCQEIWSNTEDCQTQCNGQ